MSGDWLAMGVPDWLSDRTRRQIVAEEARERAQAVREERERAERAETAHERAVACYRSMAEMRGEDIDVMALAMGQGGRTIQDVITSAAAMADRQDAMDAARARREAENPQPLHVFVGEPVIVDASPTRRALLNRSRHWREWRERLRQAEAARRALETANHITLDHPVTLKTGQE
jgi:pyruvate/2-oxoglutarate dehydrogenase complex dihydrolipoamide acyltransferase (E2) component